MSEIINCAVLRAFKDKNTQKHHSKGGTYESDDPKRIAYLQERGFLGEVISGPVEIDNNDGLENDDAQIKHVGGGWYELPNGEKIKGKDEALAALKELEEEKAADQS